MNDTNQKPEDKNDYSVPMYLLKAMGGFYFSLIIVVGFLCVLESCQVNDPLEIFTMIFFGPLILMFFCSRFPFYVLAHWDSPYVSLEVKLMIAGMIIGSVVLLIAGLWFRRRRWGFLLGVGAGWLLYFAMDKSGILSI